MMQNIHGYLRKESQPIRRLKTLIWWLKILLKVQKAKVNNVRAASELEDRSFVGYQLIRDT